MLTFQEAKQRVLQCLNMRSFDDEDTSDTIVICDEFTVERPYGWIFCYESKTCRETGNMRDALFGNVPIVIEKQDGTMYVLDAGVKSLREAIQDFERERFGELAV